MSDRERPREWRTDGGVPPASSGGNAPRPERDSIFEILDAPLPSEIERRGGPGMTPAVEPRREPRREPRKEPPPTRRERRQTEKGRTATRDAAGGPGTDRLDATQAMPETRPRPTTRRTRPVGGTRRVRRTIKHLDPVSILKVSLLFYSFFLIVWLVFVALFYRVLDGMGLFDQLQSLGRDLVLPALENEITLGTVERWAAVIGVIGVIVGSLVNAFLAFLYNLISDLIGGIEVTFQERDQGP